MGDLVKNESKRYYLYGATDRLNFGDLLFPHILERLIREKNADAIIRNYAFTRSDLGSYGGMPTLSFRQMVKDVKKHPNAKVLIVGGALLDATWSEFLSFTNSRLGVIHAIENKIPLLKRLDLARRWVSPLKFFRPFILDHEVFSDAVIRYNAVSGITNNHQSLRDAAKGDGGPFWDSAVEHLRARVDYLSVRDQEAQAVLELNEVPCSLVPDSVTIAPTVFGDGLILEKASPESKTLSEERYLVVQLSGSKKKQLTDLARFAESVSAYSRRHKLTVILCPLGLANGHDDPKVLKEVKRLQPSFRYFEPKSIFDCILLLKNCDLFIGSSLHGVIVSTIYNRPAVYFRDVLKVRKYMSAWYDDDGAISFDDPCLDKVESQLEGLVESRRIKNSILNDLVTKAMEKLTS